MRASTLLVRASIPVSVMLAHAAPVHAQSEPGSFIDPDTQAGPDAKLAEIIVTARRQAENSQTVPISITAFSQETLDRQNVQDLRNLQFLVPSFSTTGQTSDMQRLNLRGQGAGSGQSQAGVVAYLNEVPICCDNNAQTIGGAGLMYDLENVQVLAGPQGTLFGRNSMGGAILFQTRRPTDDFGGFIEGTIGNYNDRELTGALNVPISQQLAIRVAGFYQKRDGFSRTLATPSHPNGLDLEDADVWSGRATITWKPVDNIQNDLIYQHLYSTNNNSSFRLTQIHPFFPFIFPVPGLPAFLQSLADQQASLGTRTSVPLSVDPFSRTRYQTLTDILKIELSPDVTFRNIASWSKIKRAMSVDFDGLPLPILDYPYSGQIDSQWTEEAQLQGNNGKLNWTAGFYYSHIPEGPAALYTSNFFFTPTDNDLVKQSFTSKALYAQGTYEVVDNLKFTAGFRYTWDSQSKQIVSLDENFQCVMPPVGRDANCSIRNAGSWHAPAWTLGLDYQVTPTTLLYVAHRHAYRTGGFNSSANNPFTSKFDPETVNDIELGVKSEFSLLGMPTRLNVAAYHQWYKDIQVSVTAAYVDELGQTTTYNLVKNGAAATIKGVEVQGNIRPLPGLELGGNFAYLKLKFTDFDPSATASDIAQLQSTVLEGRPKFKFNLNGQYTTALPGDAGEISLGANYSWQSKSGPLNQFATTPSFGLLNLNASWNKLLGTPLDLSLFMNNATNVKRSYTSLPYYESFLFNMGYFLPPRTYGARLRYSF